MTPLYDNKAFTLIELLIVVLIIGILAAVAVPQYKKAVTKSKAMQGLTLIKEIAQGEELYYLEHGTYPQEFEKLAWTLPQDFKQESNYGTFDRHKNDEWRISILDQTGYEGILIIEYHKNPYLGMAFAYVPRLFKSNTAAVRGNLGKIMCVEASINSINNMNNKFCKQLFNGTDKRTTGGYYWYVMN